MFGDRKVVGPVNVCSESQWFDILAVMNNNLRLFRLSSNRAITVQHPPHRAGNNSRYAGQHYTQKSVKLLPHYGAQRLNQPHRLYLVSIHQMAQPAQTGIDWLCYCHLVHQICSRSNFSSTVLTLRSVHPLSNERATFKKESSIGKT